MLRLALRSIIRRNLHPLHTSNPYLPGIIHQLIKSHNHLISTVDQFSGESSPVILRLDDKQMIKGLKEFLTGMKVGGKRRALIPPAVGYTSEALQPIPEEFGPRRSLLSHAKEPLIFEVTNDDDQE